MLDEGALIITFRDGRNRRRPRLILWKGALANYREAALECKRRAVRLPGKWKFSYLLSWVVSSLDVRNCLDFPH